MIWLTIALALGLVFAIVEAVALAEQARELHTERDEARHDRARLRNQVVRLTEERDHARAEGDVARVRQQMNADLAEDVARKMRATETELARFRTAFRGEMERQVGAELIDLHAPATKPVVVQFPKSGA